MFNINAFASQKSPVSNGLTAATMGRLRQLLNKLLHSPETGVSYLYNAYNATLSHGMLVSINNNPAREVVPSTAIVDDAQPMLARAVAVVLGRVPVDSWGYFRHAGEAEVLLVNDLTPDEGDRVYVAENVAPNLGKGTNAEPADPSSWIRMMGFVNDASMYVTVTNPYVRMIIEPCCMWQNPPD